MYTNQKKLIQKNIGKEIPFNPEDKAHIKADIRFHNGFLYIRNEVISRAMCNLTGNSLKLYLYLMFWRGKKTIAFSRQAVCNDTGIATLAGVSRAMDELKRKNYLYEENGTLYFSPI